MARTGTVAYLQSRAWGYYGFPGTENRAVGEVRYVVGWHADQMTRLDWDVLIDGSDEWAVTIGEGDTARTVTTRRGDGEQDVTEASKELLDLIDWNDTNIRAIDTNLFVAGSGDFAELDDGWRVVSAVEPKRKEILENRTSVPILWPHPADPKKPDAPLFSVLELLDELDWMNRQARTQSRQRVLTSGVTILSDSFLGPNGTGFWETWNEATRAKMVDPDDMSPINFTGPFDQVKDGFNWIVPPFGYDAVIDRRALATINRLAYGLPIPPEILLGLQAQSRATAFQVEENAYRAHIEPPALLVAQVAADALELLLDQKVEVVPNPSRLLARRNSVQDVKDAYDRGLVTPEYVREVLGIPEDAAPELDGMPPAAGTGAAPSDPANDAAGEGSPINASAGQDLSTLLADIDTALASELAGVTVMATERARQRLGAAARSAWNRSKSENATKYGKLSNTQLATTLGMQGLENAGVSVADVIAEPVDSAARWWVRRVGEVWEQVGQLVPGWRGQGAWVEESVAVLADALVSHILVTLPEPESPPLEAGGIRKVVDAAAGDR